MEFDKTGPISFFRKIFQSDKIEIYDFHKEPDIEEYVKKRYEKQLQWYEQHALISRIRFYVFYFMIIFFGALIPIINGIPIEEKYNDTIKIITSILGGTIVIFTGILQLTKSQENWISYRSSAELLKSEYNLFKMNAGDYTDANVSDQTKRERLFVTRIEKIISEEGKKFLSSNEKFDQSSKPTLLI